MQEKAIDGFEELYRLHAATVESWLTLEAGAPSAESLFQDVWAAFYQRWRRWRPGEHEDAGGTMPGFLYQTCRNVLRAHRRRAQPEAEERSIEDLAGPCLARAREACPAEELSVLVARLAGLPDWESARALELTESVVADFYARALERLRQDLGPEVESRLRQDWQELSRRLSSHGAASRKLVPDELDVARANVLFAEIEDIRTEWRQLRTSDALERHAERFVSTGTVKELVAHVASWAREYRREAELAGRGEEPDYVIPYGLSAAGPREWNDAEVELRQSRSFDELGGELEAETHRLQELVLELPEEVLGREHPFPLARTADPATVWAGDIARLVNQLMYGHCLYHLGQLREVTAGPSRT